MPANPYETKDWFSKFTGIELVQISLATIIFRTYPSKTSQWSFTVEGLARPSSASGAHRDMLLAYSHFGASNSPSSSIERLYSPTPNAKAYVIPSSSQDWHQPSSMHRPMLAYFDPEVFLSLNSSEDIENQAALILNSLRITSKSGNPDSLHFVTHRESGNPDFPKSHCITYESGSPDSLLLATYKEPGSPGSPLLIASQFSK